MITNEIILATKLYFTHSHSLVTSENLVVVGCMLQDSVHSMLLPLMAQFRRKNRACAKQQMHGCYPFA